MSKIKRARNKAIIVLAWVLVACWVVVTAALLWPYHSITFSPFVTDETTYRAGDLITLSDRFCWDGTPFISYRFFESDTARSSAGSVEFPNGYATAEVAQRYASGCTTAHVRLQVPEGLPPGKWRIAYEVKYKPNPIRTVSIENDSNEFTITP